MTILHHEVYMKTQEILPKFFKFSCTLSCPSLPCQRLEVMGDSICYKIQILHNFLRNQQQNRIELGCFQGFHYINHNIFLHLFGICPLARRHRWGPLRGEYFPLGWRAINYSKTCNHVMADDYYWVNLK